MAVSRAELEAMDRDELLDVIVEMGQEVTDIRARVEEDFESAGRDRAGIRGKVNDLEQRVDELESENERLRERLDSTTAGSKQDKLNQIVAYAANKQSDGISVLTPAEIQGACGCSERYAYKLADTEDGLPAEYSWIMSREDLVHSQYGEIERATEDGPKRIGIDFEGDHSSGVPLNMINNAINSEGGED